MKTSILCFLPLFLLFNYCVNAQINTITKSYKTEVVTELSKELKDSYVFPKIADQVSKKLKDLMQKGHFDKYNQLNDFAEALTHSIYKISNDKHVIVHMKKINETTKENGNAVSDRMSVRLDERTYYRRYNANFKSVKKIDENIGYLDLRGFYGLDYGREFADYVMAMLSTSDAIIIDLRNNSGGRGDMVEYLLSYFFDKPIITGRSLKRNGDEFRERTHMSFGGNSNKKIPETPLFILTSAETFSAAEAFSYPLQVYKRALIVGETTKGGANAGDLIPINDELEVFIPDVAALPHPVSNANLEGIGVIPDIKVKSIEALKEAINLAQIAAREHKFKMDEKAKRTLQRTYGLLENFKGKDTQKMIDAFLECRKHDVIFEEWELNRMGYQFLNEKKIETALAIFKTNTILYPYSENTYYSYAETLVENGKVKDGILYYEKAVSIAKANNDKNLNVIQQSLEKAKKLNKS